MEPLLSQKGLKLLDRDYIFSLTGFSAGFCTKNKHGILAWKSMEKTKVPQNRLWWMKE